MIEDIKARLTKATKGPWRYVSRPDSIPRCNRVESAAGVFICKGSDDMSAGLLTADDGEFIAAAREDLDYLIKEHEALLVKYEEVTKNHTLVINLMDLPDAKT